jgi:hypothetical protein
MSLFARQQEAAQHLFGVGRILATGEAAIVGPHAPTVVPRVSNRGSVKNEANIDPGKGKDIDAPSAWFVESMRMGCPVGGRVARTQVRSGYGPQLVGHGCSGSFPRFCLTPELILTPPGALSFAVWLLPDVPVPESGDLWQKLNQIRTRSELAAADAVHPKLDWANLHLHYDDVAYCVEWHDRLWPEDKRSKEIGATRSARALSPHRCRLTRAAGGAPRAGWDQRCGTPSRPATVTNDAETVARILIGEAWARFMCKPSPPQWMLRFGTPGLAGV